MAKALSRVFFSTFSISILGFSAVQAATLETHHEITTIKMSKFNGCANTIGSGIRRLTPQNEGMSIHMYCGGASFDPTHSSIIIKMKFADDYVTDAAGYVDFQGEKLNTDRCQYVSAFIQNAMSQVDRSGMKVRFEPNCRKKSPTSSIFSLRVKVDRDPRTWGFSTNKDFSSICRVDSNRRVRVTFRNKGTERITLSSSNTEFFMYDEYGYEVIPSNNFNISTRNIEPGQSSVFTLSSAPRFATICRFGVLDSLDRYVIAPMREVKAPYIFDQENAQRDTSDELTCRQYYSGGDWQPYHALGGYVGGAGTGYTDLASCQDSTFSSTNGLVCNYYFGTYRPYKQRWGNDPIGYSSNGFTLASECNDAVINSFDNLVCNWNGSRFAPYRISDEEMIGYSSYGYDYPSECIDAVASNRNQFVCQWNGYRFQPHDVKTDTSIGFSNDGFVGKLECNQAVRGSRGDLICSEWSEDYAVFNRKLSKIWPTNSRRFLNLQECIDYIESDLY